MAFQNDSFASVWTVKREPGKKYSDVQITTSHKRKDTGAYETDFSGFVRFIGTANDDISSLLGNETERRAQVDQSTGRRTPLLRIKLKSVAATQTYNAEQKKTYTNFQCFAYEPADQQQARPQFDASIPDGVVDEELPF